MLRNQYFKHQIFCFAKIKSAFQTLQYGEQVLQGKKTLIPLWRV